MREIRLSGSEGGGALTGSPYPYPDPAGREVPSSPGNRLPSAAG